MRPPPRGQPEFSSYDFRVSFLARQHLLKEFERAGIV